MANQDSHDPQPLAEGSPARAPSHHHLEASADDISGSRTHSVELFEPGSRPIPRRLVQVDLALSAAALGSVERSAQCEAGFLKRVLIKLEPTHKHVVSELVRGSKLMRGRLKTYAVLEQGVVRLAIEAITEGLAPAALHQLEGAASELIGRLRRLAELPPEGRAKEKAALEKKATKTLEGLATLGVTAINFVSGDGGRTPRAPETQSPLAQLGGTDADAPANQAQVAVEAQSIPLLTPPHSHVPHAPSTPSQEAQIWQLRVLRPAGRKNSGSPQRAPV